MATADVAATHLTKLYDINTGHLTPPGTEFTVGHYTATQWRDPEANTRQSQRRHRRSVMADGDLPELGGRVSPHVQSACYFKAGAGDPAQHRFYVPSPSKKQGANPASSDGRSFNGFHGDALHSSLYAVG